MFRGNAGLWLKAAEELSQMSVMFKSFYIVLLILIGEGAASVSFGVEAD